MSISQILENWYDTNKRDLPWRNTRSAYHIWLSEIILQQTRVNQGLDYYHKFVTRFPSIEDLAIAPLDEVLRLWQGLGYYTRARNLHITAKTIADEYGGVFPRKYDELLKLKGIGEYTAAAIASIAFKEPVALVDGNVYRVLSRLFAIYTPVNTAAGKTLFVKLATEILNPKTPDIHNQAMMEFGALVCLPRNPLCDLCVLAKYCKAKTGGLVDVLPVKEGKRRVRTRYFHYLVLRHNDKTYINRRNNKDIWNSLFEFPLIETEIREDFHKLAACPPWNSLLKNSPFELQGKPKTYKHQLTHQTLYCSFYLVNIQEEPVKTDPDYFPVAFKQLDGFAVPKVIDRYLGDLKDEGIV